MQSSREVNTLGLVVLRFADFECQDGSAKLVRLSLAKDQKHQYSVHKHEYGFGRTRLSVENRCGPKFRLEHFAVDAFESEMVLLEQEGYDLVNERTHDIPELKLDKLKLRGYKSIAYKSLSHAAKQAIEGRHTLRVHSGLHVVIVADAFMGISMYPANRVGVEGCEIPMSKLSGMFVNHHAYKKGPSPSIIEGFYSDDNGITLTDAIMLEGEYIGEEPFSVRYHKLVNAFPIQGTIFTDGVAQLLPGDASRIGETSTAVTHSPMFIVKSEVGSTTVGYAFSEQQDGFSVIIDDDAAAMSSVRISRGQMVIQGLYVDHNAVFAPVVNSDYFECLNAAGYLRDNSRIPLLFF